jgi:HSP20 family molecular chaperone IbpA
VTIQEALAKARKDVKTVTTYRLGEDAPIVDAQDAGDRVRPISVEVTEFDDGEIRISVTGYKVKKNGERKGAPWHGISYEAQKQFEEALGFRRVRKASN